MTNKTLNLIVLILLVIGGLNWGLVGFLNYDLVASIFGAMTLITMIIYSLVGIAAIFGLIGLFTKENM